MIRGLMYYRIGDDGNLIRFNKKNLNRMILQTCNSPNITESRRWRNRKMGGTWLAKTPSISNERNTKRKGKKCLLDGKWANNTRVNTWACVYQTSADMDYPQNSGQPFLSIGMFWNISRKKIKFDSWLAASRCATCHSVAAIALALRTAFVPCV